MKKRIAVTFLVAVMLVMAAFGGLSMTVPAEAEGVWEPEYAGVYQRLWVEEIGGTYVENIEYIILNEDYTGYWVAQDVGMLTWDESQLMLNVGEVLDIALTHENEVDCLLVYKFQDENGAWIPTVYEKVPELPADIAAMLPEVSAEDAAVSLPFAGNYADSVSQRAMMQTAQQGKGLSILVSWASSAFQQTTWEMDAVLAEGKLEYTQCRKTETTYLENGEAEDVQISDIGGGYFTIQDGKLLWDGAAEESCRACVFEMLPAVVSYLGPEGTYSQEACIHFFGKEGSHVPYQTVNDTVEALLAGESDYVVIPQENTIGGAVTDYIDTLIARKEVSVVGEVELPITQNLLGLEGAELAQIRTVYSHKQGILQGADWMKKNLPQAEVTEVSSTAEGARMVAEANDPTVAAIASAACVDVYHLEMLAQSIQENDSNVTRFYVLSREAAQTEASDRMVFIASGNAKGLPKLLAQMDEENMTLITIHDRPAKTELGEYDYVIECEDASYDAYCKLEENNGFTFRYLGSFRVTE